MQLVKSEKLERPEANQAMAPSSWEEKLQLYGKQVAPT